MNNNQWNIIQKSLENASCKFNGYIPGILWEKEFPNICIPEIKNKNIKWQYLLEKLNDNLRKIDMYSKYKGFDDNYWIFSVYPIEYNI